MITNIDQLDLNKTYTYADYLTWQFDEMVELIKGKVQRMSPAPLRRHQFVSNRLSYLITSYFETHPCNIYVAPFDVRLYKTDKNDHKVQTVVQPDISVICDSSKLDDRGCIGSPDLIIEILSKTSKKRDIHDKYELYEENKSIQDHRNVGIRLKYAKALCSKCKLPWDQPVSFLEIP